MKQKYMKPAMVMERFELSQSIATGCGAASSGHPLGNPNQWSKHTCGWIIDEYNIIWIDEANRCNDFAGADEDVGGICYNNPGGGQTIFNS